jgi:hypothetical protein
MQVGWGRFGAIFFAVKDLSRDSRRRAFRSKSRIQPLLKSVQDILAAAQAFFSRSTASQGADPVNLRPETWPSSNETRGCEGFTANSMVRVRRRGSRSIS